MRTERHCRPTSGGPSRRCWSERSTMATRCQPAPETTTQRCCRCGWGSRRRTRSPLPMLRQNRGWKRAQLHLCGYREVCDRNTRRCPRSGHDRSAAACCAVKLRTHLRPARRRGLLRLPEQGAAITGRPAEPGSGQRALYPDSALLHYRRSRNYLSARATGSGPACQTTL